MSTLHSKKDCVGLQQHLLWSPSHMIKKTPKSKLAFCLAAPATICKTAPDRIMDHTLKKCCIPNALYGIGDTIIWKKYTSSLNLKVIPQIQILNKKQLQIYHKFILLIFPLSLCTRGHVIQI